MFICQFQQNLMSPLIPPSSALASSMGPSTPGPMTPMTPASADPGILPQLQYVFKNIYLKILYSEKINF